MKRISVTVACCVILLATPGSARMVAQQTAVANHFAREANGPAATVDAFHAALKRGDRDAALALLSADLLVYEAGGAERNRVQYASHHLAADAAFAAATVQKSVRRSGQAIGDLAWITSEGRTTGRYKERPVDRMTAETMLLRRYADRWIIQHIHWSSRAAPR